MNRFCFLLLGLLALTTAASAQEDPPDFWESVPGPYGGTIAEATVTLADGTVLAGTQGGVFKLAPGSTTWQVDKAGLVVADVRAMVLASDGTVFIGTFGDGVFKRPPTETTWQPTGLRGVFMTALAVRSDGVLFAGTVGGLLTSTDGGENWTETAQLNPNSEIGVTALAFTASHLLAGTAEGVYRSPDGGNTWSLVAAGMDNTNITALATTASGVAFAGTSPVFSGCTIFRSRNIDSAATPLWTCVEPFADPFQVKALSVRGDGTVFAGGFRLSYRSTNEGDSWAQAITTSTTILDFAFTANAVYAATFGRGILQSTDGGVTWQETNEGMLSSIRDVTTNALGEVIVGTEGGVYKSSDRGETWTLMNTGLNTLSIRALLVTPSGDLIAGTFAGAYFYDTGTASWILLGPPANPGMRDLAMGTNGEIYGGYYAGIFALENGAWTSLDVIGPDEFTRDIISVGVLPDGTLIAGAFFEVFRHETDGSWTQMRWNGNIFEGQDVLVASDGTIYVGTRFIGVVASADRGDTWTRLSGGLTGSEDMQVLAFDPSGRLHAGTFGSGVLRFNADTEMWSTLNTGLTDLRALSLAIDAQGNFYTGTLGGGLFRHRFEQDTATEADPTQPTTFALHGNYPNPFNPTTTLRFDLPEAATVEVALYDLLGRQVQTLAAQPFTAGQQHLTLDASTLASGLYLYRLTAHTPTTTWQGHGRLLLAK